MMFRWRPTPNPAWAHLDLRLDRIETRLTRIIKQGEAMSEAQSNIDADVAQLTKALGEIRGLVDQQVQAIADLTAQVAAGATPNLDALTAISQSLDDVVPDLPPVEPPA